MRETRCALQPIQIAVVPSPFAWPQADQTVIWRMKVAAYKELKKKKPLGDVADVTSKSLQRGLGSVKKLMQQDWHSTWDDCRSSHSHSPNRAEDIPTQTFCCQICRDCLQ